MNLQACIEYDLKVKISDLTDRLEAVQYTLYQTENPDTRFNKIYEKLSLLEAGRKKDHESATDQRREI